MSEPIDMDAPVTHRQLHDALGTWAGAITQNIITQVKALLEQVVVSLKADATAMEARLMSKVDAVAMEARLMSKVDAVAMEARLMGELKRHTAASAEELTQRVVTLDEPYRDLPARVTRLEAKVFAKRSGTTVRRRKRS